MLLAESKQRQTVNIKEALKVQTKWWVSAHTAWEVSVGCEWHSLGIKNKAFRKGGRREVTHNCIGN